MVVSGFSKFSQRILIVLHQGIALDIVSLRTTIEGGGWSSNGGFFKLRNRQPKARQQMGQTVKFMSNLMVSVEVFQQKKLIPDMF